MAKKAAARKLSEAFADLSPEEQRKGVQGLEQQLDQVRRIVATTDEHRIRSRREAWDAIKAVLAGELPAEEEPVAEEAPAEVAEDETSEESSQEEGSTAGAEVEGAGEAESELPAEEEPVVEEAAPVRKRRFAEPEG